MSPEFDKQMSARRELMELSVNFRAKEGARQDSSKERNRKLLAGSALAFVCALTVIQHDEIADSYDYVAKSTVTLQNHVADYVVDDILDLDVKKVTGTNETTNEASESESSELFAHGITGLMAIYSLSALAGAGFAEYRRRDSQKVIQLQVKLGSLLADEGQIPEPDWVTQELKATEF